VRCPESFTAERLLFRRPTAADAPLMFARYASNLEVTRLLAWPTHRSVEQTQAFVAFSDQTWAQHGVGPWLVWTKDGATLLGSTGLDPEAPGTASTGYVLATDAWGQGLATEVLRAMVEQARAAGLRRLSACVHPSNVASIRVLEKCGLARTGEGSPTAVFPNLAPSKPEPIFTFALTLD
jgi:ribosomal-protein-alanine N-acetyltransferase